MRTDVTIPSAASPRETLGSRLPVRLLVIALLTLGVMARGATFQSPLFDFHSWRQSDSASIARNFFEERFNPLYPQVDWRGDAAHGYVETGFELHALIVAGLAHVFGFSTHLGRLVNALMFPVAALLLYRFIRARYGEWSGLIGLHIYALGLPLTLFMDRAFMNESLLTLLVIGCLRTTQLYLQNGRMVYLASLLVASILVAIVKPTFLIVWGPLLGLFIERDGVRALLRWELWLAGTATVAAAVAWFTHAHTLFTMTGLSFGLSNKLFDTDLVLTLRYWSKIATRLVKDVLGPVGIAFAAYGLVVAVRQRRWAEPLGVAAFVAYLIVITNGNFHHNYYQLPIVPIGVVLAALGVSEALTRMSERRGWTFDRLVYVCAALLWAVTVSTFARSVSFHSWYEVDERRVRVCEQLAPLLDPADRVAFTNYLSPDILFCLHRKGWLLSEAGPEQFLDLLKKGAVIVTDRAATENVRVLDGLATLITSTPEFLAYRLAPPEPPASPR